MEKVLAVCFTGHRPRILPWGYDENKEGCIKFKNDLYIILRNVIIYGVTTFFVGMAEGFDMIACESILKLKKEFSSIRLIAVVPCINQEKFWSESQKKRYIQLLSKCDEKVVISQTYTKSCMNDRNKYMVEHSSICVACFNGNAGGTRNTILYAKEKGLKIKIINPDLYK